MGWKEHSEANEKITTAVTEQHHIRAYRLVMWAYEEGARNALDVLYNYMVMGGRVITAETACSLVGIWLDSQFEGDRHQRRLDKIAQIEDEVRKG